MTTPPKDCANCFEKQPVYKNFETDYIGELRHWETSFNTCRTCGAKNVRCFLEDDGYPRSGRWYLVFVPRETIKARLTPLKILELIAREDRVYYGGSHYASTGKWGNAPHHYYLREYRQDTAPDENYDS